MLAQTTNIFIVSLWSFYYYFTVHLFLYFLAIFLRFITSHVPSRISYVIGKLFNTTGAHKQSQRDICIFLQTDQQCIKRMKSISQKQNFCFVNGIFGVNQLTVFHEIKKVSIKRCHKNLICFCKLCLLRWRLKNQVYILFVICFHS